MRRSEKQRLNLQRRRADYGKMISDPKFDPKNLNAYRKPGSAKKGYKG